MTISTIVADQLYKVHFGKNWTYVWLNEVVKDISFHEATAAVYGCNTIHVLVFHLIFYIERSLHAMETGNLNMEDKDAFNAPAIDTEADWQALVQRLLDGAQVLEKKIRALPESVWNEPFIHEGNSTYLHLFLGITEHTHYHLGQIVLLKKIIRSQKQEK